MNHSTRVCHKSEALVIVIPTVCPAAMHFSLLQGINEVLRIAANHQSGCTERADFSALFLLQRYLIPDEAALEKAFE